MIEGIILSRNGSFKTDGESYIEDGILSLENDKTRIISATDFASIDSLKVAGTTSEGKSRLAVYCEYDDISEAIRFISDSGTSIREYKMFGEHNTDLLSPVIQNLFAGGEISMVKSVQRGKVNYQTVTNTDSSFNISTSTSGYNAFYVDVTINAVDTSKAFVNLFHYSTSYIAYLINSTTLRVYVSDTDSTSATMYGFSWEVVEYY